MTVNLEALYNALKYSRLPAPRHAGQRTKLYVRSRLSLLSEEYYNESVTDESYTALTLVAVHYNIAKGKHELQWEIEI